MRRAFKRLVALLLLSVLGFAHASIALAACPMEGGTLARVMAPAAVDDSGCCDVSLSGFDSLYANRCLAHCTADLQTVGEPAAIDHSADASVLVLPPRLERYSGPPAGRDWPTPGVVPRRILLHSFLI